MKKKILPIIWLLLILSLFFNYSLSKSNHQYEQYISSVIQNDVSILSSTIAVNTSSLADILEDQKITNNEIDILKENFSLINEKGDNLITLSERWLNKSEVDTSYNHSPFPTYMAVNFIRYLDELKNSNNGNINSEELMKIELMHKVVKQWNTAITEKIKGLDSNFYDRLDESELSSTLSYIDITTDEYRNYYDEMVNNNDWVDMINRMQAYTEDLQYEVENTF